MLAHGTMSAALPYLWPIAWVVVAVAIGIVIDRFALARFARGHIASTHRWIAIGIDALRAGIVFWCAIAGIHAAMVTSSLDRNVEHILDNVLLVLGFGSITWVAARFAGNVVHDQTSGFGGRVLSASLLATIAQTAIVCVGVLVILQSLGVAIGALLTALGVGGLAVALALQPTLANLFAGVQLVASKSLRPGDFINVSGFEGYVEDVTWRTTSLRDLTNNIVIVPNQTIANAAFVNFRLGGRAVAIDLPFTMKAGSDPDALERAALDAAKSALAALGVTIPPAPIPLVRFDQVTDGSIQAHLIVRVPESVDAERVRNETVKRLYRALGPTS